MVAVHVVTATYIVSYIHVYDRHVRIMLDVNYIDSERKVLFRH